MVYNYIDADGEKPLTDKEVREGRAVRAMLLALQLIQRRRSGNRFITDQGEAHLIAKTIAQAEAAGIKAS